MSEGRLKHMSRNNTLLPSHLHYILYPPFYTDRTCYEFDMNAHTICKQLILLSSLQSSTSTTKSSLFSQILASMLPGFLIRYYSTGSVRVLVAIPKVFWPICYLEPDRHNRYLNGNRLLLCEWRTTVKTAYSRLETGYFKELSNVSICTVWYKFLKALEYCASFGFLWNNCSVSTIITLCFGSSKCLTFCGILSGY